MTQRWTHRPEGSNWGEFGPDDQLGRDNVRLIEELGLVEYLADRFAIAGTLDECVRKIEIAAEAGATHCWMSAYFAGKEQCMRQWGEVVIPRFRM